MDSDELESTQSADPVMAAAARRWIARRSAGLTEAEQEELVAWLVADARHAEAFAEMEMETEAEGAASSLASSPGAGVPGAPMGTKDAASVRRRRSQGWALVSFIGAAILLVVYFMIRR